MKLHLPLRLRYSILTLLAASVPYFSAPVFAEDITVASGNTESVKAINGGNVTLEENATLKVVDETIIKQGADLRSQLKETKAIIGTLTLANGSKVDSRGTYPIYGINLLSNTRFEIDTINLLAGASSSIVGRDIILGDIVTTEGGSSSLSITSYGNISFNAGRVSNGVQLHLKGDLSLGEGSVVTASSFTGELTIGEGSSFTVTETIILTGTSTNDGSLTLANLTNLSLGDVEGAGKLILGDGEGSADTAANASSYAGSLDIKADAALNVEGTTSLTGDSTNSGSLVTEDLTHSGKASLTGTGALTVSGTTTLTGSTLTIANSRQINLDTVNGTGRLELGDNVLTDGEADTYVSINSVSSGTVYIQQDATLELADGATVGSTLVVNGNLLGTSIELTENGKMELYNNLDASGLSITGSGAILMGGSDNTINAPTQTVSFDSFTAVVDIYQKKQILQANSATLLRDSRLQGGTLEVGQLTLAENATLSQTGKLVAAEITMKDGSWLDWRDSGTLESAALTEGEGDTAVNAPARIHMEQGSTLSFLHELETNRKDVTLFADVTGNGMVGIGYFLSPAGYTNVSPLNVTIQGVLQAGATSTANTCNGLVVGNGSTLTFATGDWTKGTDSLVLSGNSEIMGTATVNMKYGRLKLNDGATLKIGGTFNYLTLEEGEADDDMYRRSVYLGSGAELTLATSSVTSFKSVDGAGKLILRDGAPDTFEIESDFTGSFTLISGRDLNVAGTTTLNGDSSGSGGSVVTTRTLTNNSTATLSSAEVQASYTVLGSGSLTLQYSASLTLGELSGDGDLILTSATANATAARDSHVQVGKGSQFTLSSDEEKQNNFTMSGEGTVVLGDGNGTKDTMVSSTNADIDTLNVKSDADLEVTGAGNITTLTVDVGGRFSMANGASFTLNSVTNKGTIVLGDGSLDNNNIDTEVSLTSITGTGQLQILQDSRLNLSKDFSLNGDIINAGIIQGTNATVAEDLNLTGNGSLNLDSLTINEGVTASLNGVSSIKSFANNNSLILGDGNLTDGKQDTVLDLSGASAPYTIQGGSLQIGRDAALVTGVNNTLVISGNSTIAGGLQAGEVQLSGGVILTIQDSTDVAVGKMACETSKTDAYLVLGSGAAVENGQFTTKVEIDELVDVNLTVNRDAELVISNLTLKGELNNAGYINGSEGGILRFSQDATLTGSGRVHFAETQLAPNPTLTVKNVADAHLGRIYGPTNGWGILVLGDGESESGFDTIVTADSVEAYHLTVNSDTRLTTQFLSLQGNGDSRNFTINGLVTTDYIAPWFKDGSLRLNAADFEKITVNKGAKLYAKNSLELQNVSLSFESVEQMDTTKDCGTLKLGDGRLTDGKKDTTLSVSGVFDAKVEVSSDAALTVTNTANLYNRYNYIDGSLSAGNLNLNDDARVIATGYLNVTGETTLGTGSRLELTGSREMNLGVLKGAGTLVLGNGDNSDTTSVTVSSFEGMLDIKSDAGLNVSGATTLLNESANAGTLQTNSLTLTEGALLNNSGTIVVETGVISLNTDSTLALTGVSGGLTCSVSGTGTLQVGDGDETIRTSAELPDFRGLLDIKSDGSLTTSTTTLISVQKDENSLVIDSFINGSLTTQNLNIEGKVNLSGAGTLLVQSATTLAKDATLNLWGSEKLSLGAVSGTGGSTLALGTTGISTSAVATTFNCSDLMLAGDTTFTVSGDFTAVTVDMGLEAGATLHVQNGKVSLNDIGNAYGLQTGTLILGDGERRLVTEAQGDTPAVTEADTIAAVNGLNLSALELRSDATLTMSGNGDFKTGTIAMEKGALLDLSTSGPIIELGTVTGAGKMVLGAEKRATATSVEGDLDIGEKATMMVESSYTGALNIGTGATMKVTNEQSGITTLTGESTNAGTLYSRILKLKDKASLSGDGYLANVNTIQLESGTRLNLTNSARPEGTVIGGYEHDTLALNTIDGKGAFVMYKDTKVMADSFSGCLGMRTGSTLIVDGKATLSGVGAGYGTLVTRELVIAAKSGFETHYKDALPTSYDYDGEGSNPAVALTLNLEEGSYLHMYKTSMQDFLDSMTNDSITLNVDAVFYGQGNLHIDQGILDKFALLAGKIQVSGILSYDSNVILTGCEGLFEGGVTDPSTAEVFSGDASGGDISGGDSGGELPEAQEVTDNVADEIVQEEFNDGVDPGPDVDITPDPEINPGPSDGGIDTGDVIGGIADAAVIAGGAAGIVATGLKVYGKVKAAKYAAIAAVGIGTVGAITKIVLTLTEDDEEDTDEFSIIESKDPLTIINTAIASGNEQLFDIIAEKSKELQDSGALKEFDIKLNGNTEVDIKEQLDAWFPEFDDLEGGKLCISSPDTTITGSVILGGDDIIFKGYSNNDADLKNFDLMGDELTFNKGDVGRTTKVVAKDTLRLRAYDINVCEGTILAARDVDIKSKTLEVSGDSYIVSTEKATLRVDDTTEVSGSTVYLCGVTDGSKLGKLIAKDGARVVLDGSSSSTVKATSVQLQNSDLTVKNMKAAVSGDTTIGSGSTLMVSNATYNTKSMEVNSSGLLVNDNGTISSTNAIVVNGGTIQGSGTFSAITLNSGKLLVGDSMEQMSFTGDLVLGDGDIRFSVETFETVALDSWNADVCSSVDMRGNDFIFGDDSVLEVGFCGNTKEALAAARDSATVTFSLTLVQNVGNVSFFTEEVLAAMLENTKLLLTPDAGASGGISINGDNISQYSSNLKYAIKAGNMNGTYNIVLSGNFGRVDSIPEPTTTALSLLALAGLALRRRRK